MIHHLARRRLLTDLGGRPLAALRPGLAEDLPDGLVSLGLVADQLDWLRLVLGINVEYLQNSDYVVDFIVKNFDTVVMCYMEASKQS